MDVAAFQTALLRALADCSFVQAVDLHSEAVVVKGRVLLEKERFLQVYFNEQTGTSAYALIDDEERLWGVATTHCADGTCPRWNIRISTERLPPCHPTR